jgi:hypothetical protein
VGNSVGGLAAGDFRVCAQRARGCELTVGEDIDGLVVEVEEGMHAAPHALHGPVAGEDVGVELQVPGHVVPLEEASLLLLVGVHG